MHNASPLCPAAGRKSRILVAAALLLLSSVASSADFSRSPLRSAQMLSHDGEWAAVTPRTAGDERREIRNHFAAVGQRLEVDRVSSLDLAVARFEQTLQVSLAPLDRAELRARLAERRDLQLQRLRQYASAGRFPLNRHYAGEARPIFVDAGGTHCAVGHLMALDGWEPRVLEIARAAPNVLVNDVRGGPLVSWVLTSGLTQEEAALIQPGYYPPPGSDATGLASLVVPGAALERDGFRYENFSFTASASGGAAAPTAADFTAIYGWPPRLIPPGVFCGGDYTPTCVPSRNTLWFGYDWGGDTGILDTEAGQAISLEVAYDVVSLFPGLSIRGVGIDLSPLYNPDFVALQPGTSFTTAIETAGETLANTVELLFPYVPPTGFSLSLQAPVERARFRHTVQLGAEASFGSFRTGMQAVPLPASGGLLLGALLFFGQRVRRSR